MAEYTPTTEDFESLADWMGEQDWTHNVRDYTDEYTTHVRGPVEHVAEAIITGSWLTEHDRQVEIAVIEKLAGMFERMSPPSFFAAGVLRDQAQKRREGENDE